MPIRELLEEKNKTKLLLLVLLLALAVRLWVFPVVFSSGGVTLLGADTYYHARRILATVADFPHALSFDSYINYPYGSSIGWAPLYDVTIAAAALIIGLGSPSLYTIEAAAAVVPLLLGVITVLLVFLIAEKLFDWRTALVSAGIFAITPAHVYVSFLGYADHHVAETLLSTAAYFFFIVSMKNMQKNNVSFTGGILNNSLFPALTGVVLALVIFTWNGAPIFVGLIGIYIVIQFVLDKKLGKSSDYLVITGGIAFLVSLLIITPVAVSQGAGFDFNSYLPSYFHVGFLAAFFSLCLLLGAMQMAQFKRWWYYLLLLVLIFASAFFSIGIISPQFYQTAEIGLGYLFGGGILATIQEAVPLFNTPTGGFTLYNVWLAFSLSFFIALMSFLYFIIKTIREKYPFEAVFLITWTLIVLTLTILQKRFIYLLAVNVAIFSAYFIISTLNLFLPDIKTKITKRKPKNQKTSNIVSNTGLIKGLSISALLPVLGIIVIKYMETEITPIKNFIPAKDFLLTVNIIIFSAYFIILILKLALPDNIVLKLFSSNNIKLIMGLSIIILLALHNLSVIRYMATENVAAPPPDLKESFTWLKDNSPATSYYTYPDKPAEYGVMSWWDYGNWILYLSQRPVVANNFQTGIDDAAHFLTASDEKTANEILTKRNVRFIVTDFQMFVRKFSYIAMFAGKKAEEYYEIRQFSDIGQMRNVNIEFKKFFMLSQLYVFDGNGLNNYRLIYESNTSVGGQESRDIKYVKIFEYVPGATITGKADGDVKLTLSVMTNQRRIFEYTRQATASNGSYEIKVPYATQGGKYATAPLSDYIIQTASKAKAVSVNEQDVLEGRTLQVDLI